MDRGTTDVKPEIRNPKSESNPNAQMTKKRSSTFSVPFRIWNLGFFSDFGFRASDFNHGLGSFVEHFPQSINTKKHPQEPFLRVREGVARSLEVAYCTVMTRSGRTICTLREPELLFH
jgi:hypothetical protein